MEVQYIEQYISIATSNDARKSEATQALDALRVSSTRWEVGLKLFFEGTNESSQFFGLSLVREYLTDVSPISEDIRRTIRETMMQWVSQSMSLKQQEMETPDTIPGNDGSHNYTIANLPHFLLNNMVSVITLCIKWDYPELWPTAFDEVLFYAKQHIAGLDLAVRIFEDVDLEVVMFEDSRSKSEMQHNMLIKDTMRHNETTRDISLLLCSSSVFLRSRIEGLGNSIKGSDGQERGNLVTNAELGFASVSQVNNLATRCLKVMSSFISWIDINIVIQDTLATIFQALQDKCLRANALLCIYSLVKKGMDPMIKVKLLESVDILSVLQGVDWFSKKKDGDEEEGDDDDDGDDSTDYDEEEDSVLSKLTMTLDMILLELIGCWATYEDLLVYQFGNQQGGVENSGGKSKSKSKTGGGVVGSGIDVSNMSQESIQELSAIAPTTATFLRSIVPMIIQVFEFENDDEVTSCALPSLNRLIQMMKYQKVHEAALISGVLQTGWNLNSSQVQSIGNGSVDVNIDNYSDKGDEVPTYFCVTEYLSSLLGTIYTQIQYAPDFGFDPSDDEDAAVMEAKKNIRKLFVNCCRVHPQECLQLIQSVFQSLPQPLSSAPVGPVEGALQITYAFGECGAHHMTQIVNEGTFPALINAVHSTDLCEHNHQYVLLSYFDLSYRYLKLCLPEAVSCITNMLTGKSGLYHPNMQVRCRAAYSILKITEQLENRAYLLVPHTEIFAKIILSTSGQLEQSMNVNTQFRIPQSQVSESAELHLLEATSLITKPRGCHYFTEIDPNKPLIATRAVTTSATQDNANKSNFKSKGSGDTGGMSGGQGDGPDYDVSSLSMQQQQQMQQHDSEQLSVMQQMVDILMNQISLILNHPYLEKFPQEFADLVSHKISSLASLSKSVNMRQGERGQLFQEGAVAIVNVCNALGQFASIRAKVIMFIHRMVNTLGDTTISMLEAVYPTLLQYSDTTDVNETVQLVNQVMIEFGEKCLPFIDTLFGPTLDRYQAVIEAFEDTQRQEKWQAEQSSAQTFNGLGMSPHLSQDTIVTEAPHIDLERASLQKHYLHFLQHVCHYKCHMVLLSDNNIHRLDYLLQQMVHGLRGSGIACPQYEDNDGNKGSKDKYNNENNGFNYHNQQQDGNGNAVLQNENNKKFQVPRVGASNGLPLRRIALNAVTSLVEVWNPNSSVLNNYNNKNDIMEKFQYFLFDHVLPIVLGGYISGVSTDNVQDLNVMLDLKDGQSQNVILDVAQLLHSCLMCYGYDTINTYLQQALPALGWGPQASQGLLHLVIQVNASVNSGEVGSMNVAQSLNSFKDQYRKVVRNALM